MALPLLLSVYYRYYPTGIVAVPVPAGIATSGHQDVLRLYCAGTVYVALLVVDPRDPPLNLWDGIPPAGISGRRVTAALGRPQKFHRKVPGRSQQESADDGCGPAGVINFFFLNVVLAHYLDY